MYVFSKNHHQRTRRSLWHLHRLKHVLPHWRRTHIDDTLIDDTVQGFMHQEKSFPDGFARDNAKLRQLLDAPDEHQI